MEAGRWRKRRVTISEFCRRAASSVRGATGTFAAPANTVSKNHHQNWFESIQSRQLPICDVAIGHRSATVCHLGNIAVRLGRKLQWDPQKEQIVGDAEASKLLRYDYRMPWELPKIG
jgi:hypothetical protein